MRSFHWNKALAYQVAKGITKEEFLSQMVDAWLEKWSTTTGSISRDKEISEMKSRIKKSGYRKAFDNAGITEVDLVTALDEALKRSGRKERQV